jgi:integrase
MVAVPASFTGTRRVRRYFKDRTEALAYVISIRQTGFVVAETAKASPGAPTVAECAALWVARHESSGIDSRSIRYVLDRLVARHGRDPVDGVGHREIDAWLQSLADREGLAPTTCHNHWRITRRFFNYCRDFLEVVSKNPFAKLKERPVQHKHPAILTPEQMSTCLDQCHGVQNNHRLGVRNDHRLTAYLCLGGFAGMRTAEILRQRWEDIDWSGGEIYVRQPKRVAAWRPRHVEILAPLRRHLEPVALPDGAIIHGGIHALYLLRREMMDRLGWGKWPSNCLRHSFRSYHAAYFKDLPRTAREMGHAVINTTFYTYGASAQRAAAAAWWEL